MSIHHFVSHLDNVIPHHGEASYVAKRLVAYPIGASGYAHAVLLTMPAGTKVLSHWHDDREAVFYCLRGKGLFILDGREEIAVPGTAMLQPLNSIHGFVACDEEFHFLDFALLTESGKSRAPDSCFVQTGDLARLDTHYGTITPFFRDFANPAIRFVGERSIDGLFSERDIDRGTEQIILVIDGEGQLDLLGSRTLLTPGSIVYLIADLPFRIEGELLMIGTSSDVGRIAEPSFFDRLRRGETLGSVAPQASPR